LQPSGRKAAGYLFLRRRLVSVQLSFLLPVRSVDFLLGDSFAISGLGFKERLSRNPPSFRLLPYQSVGYQCVERSALQPPFEWERGN